MSETKTGPAHILITKICQEWEVNNLDDVLRQARKKLNLWYKEEMSARPPTAQEFEAVGRREAVVLTREDSARRFALVLNVGKNGMTGETVRTATIVSQLPAAPSAKFGARLTREQAAAEAAKAKTSRERNVNLMGDYMDGYLGDD